MTDELFERIVLYKATMTLVKNMLADGLITEDLILVYSRGNM